MEDFLGKLPKALSAEERAVLGEPFSNNSLTHAGARHAAGNRALALIDALTAALAEAVARMTVAEASTLCPCGERESRLMAAEARVRELEAELDMALLGDRIATAKARAAEQKLADANALLGRLGLWADTYGEGEGEGEGEGVGACKAQVKTILAAQPAAPSERWAGKPGLPEREVLARSAAEYAQIIADFEAVQGRGEAVLRVIERVPAELREAWRMPHAIVGWYHDFGKAVEAYLDEKGIVSEKAGGAYGTAKVLDRAATLHAVQEQIQETLVESAGRHVCDRQDVYARGFLAINRIVEGK